MSQPSAGRSTTGPTGRGVALTLVSLLSVLMLGGCFFGGKNLYAPDRTVQTPPLSWRSDDGMFELTMEAPHTGWRLEYDTAKRSKDGPRLLFTIRRPDPSMIYPQAIVSKHVLTDQKAEPGTRVWIRVLEHDEKGGRYAPTDQMVPMPETDAAEESAEGSEP